MITMYSEISIRYDSNSLKWIQLKIHFDVLQVYNGYNDDEQLVISGSLTYTPYTIYAYGIETIFHTMLEKLN